jgi:hypothetical protein
MSSIEKALNQLSQADDEQVKMMEERVILTDYYDNVIGHGSKKESESYVESLLPKKITLYFGSSIFL